MEQERSESIDIELEPAQENFESSLDDVKAERLRRATSGFYFTLEHLAKALLLTIGVGNVLSIKISFSTEILDAGFTGFLINIADNHPGAFFYKTPGRCVADAGGL